MRRTQFITAAVVAAITFFSLHAFVGPRYVGLYGGWYGRQGYGHWRHGYYDRPWNDAPYRYDRRNGQAPAQPADTGSFRY